MSSHAPEHMLGALVRDHETTDPLADLVRECATLLPAAAVVPLVDDGSGRLELLSATSHGAAELELYQAHENTGRRCRTPGQGDERREH